MTVSAGSRDLADLVATLAPRLDEVVTRAASRAKSEIPVYESITELEIREGIARDLGAAMSALIEDRRLTEAERDAMGMIGDARARQGLPLEAMLRVYRFTVDAIFEVLWDALEQGELTQDDVLALTREVLRSADEIMDTAVASYRHRELELAVADTERRAALVHALLFSPTGAPSAMVADAAIDPTGEYVALRARAPGAERRLLLDLQAPGVLDGGAVAPYGDDVVGFARDRPRLAPEAGVVIGIGPPGALTELPRSLAIATRVVDTAAATGRHGALTIEDVALEAVARSEDSLGDALVERYVGPVEDETLNAVRAYFESELSTEAAADALSVHPNTVRNRLHRYERETGASLRSVDDLVRIRLALLRAQV
jgi:PucR C-terminal helix-turn-helix domain